ncbi:hypothetical protein ACOMHN_002720 [Nucella lapillus]
MTPCRPVQTEGKTIPLPSQAVKHPGQQASVPVTQIRFVVEVSSCLVVKESSHCVGPSVVKESSHCVGPSVVKESSHCVGPSVVKGSSHCVANDWLNPLYQHCAISGVVVHRGSHGLRHARPEQEWRVTWTPPCPARKRVEGCRAPWVTWTPPCPARKGVEGHMDSAMPGQKRSGGSQGLRHARPEREWRVTWTPPCPARKGVEGHMDSAMPGQKGSGGSHGLRHARPEREWRVTWTPPCPARKGVEGHMDSAMPGQKGSGGSHGLRHARPEQEWSRLSIGSDFILKNQTHVRRDG